jgi:hypothetical protein
MRLLGEAFHGHPAGGVASTLASGPVRCQCSRPLGPDPWVEYLVSIELYCNRVRYRPLVLEYAGIHGLAAAGRHYGLGSRTVRRWRALGLGGLLVPRLDRQAQERRWSATSRCTSIRPLS